MVATLFTSANVCDEFDTTPARATTNSAIAAKAVTNFAESFTASVPLAWVLHPATGVGLSHHLKRGPTRVSVT